MTDSRRYEIKVCPECGQQTDRWCYEHGLDMIAGERVEVVPASQLAGAVEALDRLRRAADAWDAELSSYCDGPERDELRAASLIAARLGGQS
jgi:hypothetical protein